MEDISEKGPLGERSIYEPSSERISLMEVAVSLVVLAASGVLGYFVVTYLILEGVLLCTGRDLSAGEGGMIVMILLPLACAFGTGLAISAVLRRIFKLSLISKGPS
jgi:hypothetical protein